MSTAATVLTSNKGFEEGREIFGDEVMAAALIDRLVHHCHIVTIRGNSYRLQQHTELWHSLHAAQEPEPAARRRNRARQEVATVWGSSRRWLSDFQPAEVSDWARR